MCAFLGSPGAMLLAGPPTTDGAEGLSAYRARVGPLPWLAPREILEEIRASELKGRGGGGFPLWRKLEVALESGGEPEVVVNCSESEPASRKDGVLCAHRPHLVLDGAALDSTGPRGAPGRGARARGFGPGAPRPGEGH